MDEDRILNELTTIFRHVFGNAAIVATFEMTADDIEEWDSLSHIDMIVMVEEKFGIKIPTREVTRLRNVGDLVRIVQAKKS